MKGSYLKGNIICALPQLKDIFFSRSIIYITHHNKDGAVGIVLNYKIMNIKGAELFKKLDIQDVKNQLEMEFPFHIGGPLNQKNGFILHSNDYKSENTLRVIAIFLGKGFFFEKQVPESVFELLERKHPFHSGNLNERIELANNKATNPSDLIQLASDADPFVRRLVLFNESTPEKTRLELLDSPSLMRDIHEEDNTTD